MPTSRPDMMHSPNRLLCIAAALLLGLFGCSDQHDPGGSAASVVHTATWPNFILGESAELRVPPTWNAKVISRDMPILRREPQLEWLFKPPNFLDSAQVLFSATSQDSKTNADLYVLFFEMNPETEGSLPPTSDISNLAAAALKYYRPLYAMRDRDSRPSYRVVEAKVHEYPAAFVEFHTPGPYDFFTRKPKVLTIVSTKGDRLETEEREVAAHNMTFIAILKSA